MATTAHLVVELHITAATTTIEQAAADCLTTARALKTADRDVEDAEAALHACRIAASQAAGDAHAAAVRLRNLTSDAV